MKRLLLLLSVITAMLLFFSAAAWFSFPWYAQFLADRLLEGTPYRVTISGIGIPGISSIRFRTINAVFTAPPDPCTGKMTTYSLLFENGTIEWKPEFLFQKNNQGPEAEVPAGTEAYHISIHAGSLKVLTDPDRNTFTDLDPLIKLKILFSGGKTNLPSIRPISAEYTISGASLLHRSFLLTGIGYKISLEEKNNWHQKADTLTVSKIFNNDKPLPSENFRAIFSPERDPLKPCMIRLDECKTDLFRIKADAGRIDYHMKKNQTSFILNLPEIPLNILSGSMKTSTKKMSAAGSVHAVIPVDFRDSTVIIRNGSVSADKDANLVFYSKEGKNRVSFRIGKEKGPSEFLGHINTTVSLRNRDNQHQEFAIREFSASLLEGALTTLPFSFDPAGESFPLTLTLNNVKALDRISFSGDFKGVLKGNISGTVPLVIGKNGFRILNARLHSDGGGAVTVKAPVQSKTQTNRYLSSIETRESKYLFDGPDLLISRSTGGSLSVTFSLKKLSRKTSGGELPLYNPSGRISAWHKPGNPDVVLLSDFKAGLFDGTVSVEHIDYDIAKKRGETTLNLAGIPLQTLLDLQGTKKIYATGTIKGNVPVRLNDNIFEISKGGLNAENPGQIIYSSTEEERKAANEGLRTTYEVLSNFLYADLTSSLDMDPDGNSVITIQLKGKNPQFQGGRLVELNLKVEQNLLHLFRSLSISSNIEQSISEKALLIRQNKKTDSKTKR
ncbi:MAG: hypothetical protein HGB36_12255 [Chlorobiaceae bacterium]|nr:hypothetical protein [Chlorobiaceae bacterium]